MPHHKKRGKPLDLALDENEVSQEFAGEISQNDVSNIEVKKGKKAKKRI